MEITEALENELDNFIPVEVSKDFDETIDNNIEEYDENEDTNEEKKESENFFQSNIESIWNKSIIKKPKKKSRKKITYSKRLGEDITNLLGQINILYVNGQVDECIPLLSDIIKSKPYLSEPYELLAQIYDESDNKLLALQFYVLEAMNTKKRTDLWRDIVIRAYELKQYDQALSAIARVLRVDANDIDMHKARIYIYLNQKKFHKAWYCLKVLIVKLPDQLDAVNEFVQLCIDNYWFDYAVRGYLIYLSFYTGFNYSKEIVNFFDLPKLTFTARLDDKVDITMYFIQLTNLLDLCYDIIDFDISTQMYNQILSTIVSNCLNYLIELKQSISETEKLLFPRDLSIIYSIYCMDIEEDKDINEGLDILNSIISFKHLPVEVDFNFTSDDLLDDSTIKQFIRVYYRLDNLGMRTLSKKLYVYIYHSLLAKYNLNNYLTINLSDYLADFLSNRLNNTVNISINNYLRVLCSFSEATSSLSSVNALSIYLFALDSCQFIDVKILTSFIRFIRVHDLDRCLDLLAIVNMYIDIQISRFNIYLPKDEIVNVNDSSMIIEDNDVNEQTEEDIDNQVVGLVNNKEDVNNDYDLYEDENYLNDIDKTFNEPNLIELLDSITNNPSNHLHNNSSDEMIIATDETPNDRCNSESQQVSYPIDPIFYNYLNIKEEMILFHQLLELLIDYISINSNSNPNSELTNDQNNNLFSYFTRICLPYISTCLFNQLDVKPNNKRVIRLFNNKLKVYVYINISNDISDKLSIYQSNELTNWLNIESLNLLVFQYITNLSIYLPIHELIESVYLQRLIDQLVKCLEYYNLFELKDSVTTNYQLKRSNNLFRSFSSNRIVSQIPSSYDSDNSFVSFCKTISDPLEKLANDLIDNPLDVLLINTFIRYIVTRDINIYPYINLPNDLTDFHLIELTNYPSIYQSKINNYNTYLSSLFSINQSIEQTIPMNKYHLKHQMNSIFSNLYIGHENQTKRKFVQALDNYLDAWCLDTLQPVTSLSIISLLIFLSFHRSTAKRQLVVMKSLSFLCYYKIIRYKHIELMSDSQISLTSQDDIEHIHEDGIRQEIYYNLGCAFNLIGLSHFAVQSYRLGLSVYDNSNYLSNSHSSRYLQLTREIAHNLVMIYKRSKAYELAYDIMRDYLTY